MGKQSVVTHPNAPTAGDPFDCQTDDQVLPAEIEERNRRKNVKWSYKNNRAPIDALGVTWFEFDYILH